MMQRNKILIALISPSELLKQGIPHLVAFPAKSRPCQ